MAIRKTEAIVLKCQDIRQTSLVVTFYTKDFGKINGLVKGIRTPKPRYGSYLQPFTYNEIIFYERANSDVHTISQCDLIDFFPEVRKNLKKFAYAYYIIELVDELTEPHDENSDLFKLLHLALRLLSSEEGNKVARVFEVRLLNSLGLMPNLSSCVRCGATSFGEIGFSLALGGILCEGCFQRDELFTSVLKGTIASITHMAQKGWERAVRLKLSRDVAEDIKKLLRNFLDYHIGKRLESLDFLEKMK